MKMQTNRRRFLADSAQAERRERLPDQFGQKP